MTVQKDLKRHIRARMERTGESYTAARANALRAQPVREVAPPNLPPIMVDRPTLASSIVEVAVLKLGSASARVRVLGEPGEITLRSTDLHKVVPGHIATVRLARRWTYREHAYASGTIEGVRIDARALGLEPLPLVESLPNDPAEWSEPFTDEADPYTALWRRLTGRERRCFEMHPIAWEGRAAFESGEPDEAPVCDAADAHARGDFVKARAGLMRVLHEDLRCIDAHAHLGNWAFDPLPRQARVHYDVGIAIGDLSLASMPSDAMLLWGRIYNRPYLRCLMGRGLCEWRAGEWANAEATFERILSLNPTDNQGARGCWDEVRRKVAWKDALAA